MKFSGKITKLYIGGTIGCTFLLSGLALNLFPQITKASIIQLAQTLTPEEVNLRAKQITVRIDGASVGSGTLIEHTNSSYTVLTNWHVIKNPGDYIIQTIDGRKHQVDPSSIKQLPGLDLAVLQFTTNQNYQLAEMGNSGNLNEGQSIYFAGYPGELRREDNRYYRFFPANLVGILPKSTENGYSLIYNGEAFPGMSGGPVFNQEGLMIGVHGEANINAISGGTSNYGIPINRYQAALAQLNSQPTAKNPAPSVEEKDIPEISPPQTTEVAKQPEVESTSAPEATNTNPPQPDNSNQAEVSTNPDQISSVPTFTPPAPAQETVTSEVETEAAESTTPEVPEVIVESPTVNESGDESENESEPETTETSNKPNQPEAETVNNSSNISQAPQKIALISQKTGIDYSVLRDLLKEQKWSEADLHTYKLVEQIVKTAKQQNKHVFIELKTIAEFSCPDITTIDYLWKKYSGNKFGFSSQQEVWQSVNQKGDFSTQTWRRFATQVGWKEGEVASSSGYLLYEQLSFNPTEAPLGHLPWWFSLPEEEQKVIKHLFARCNFNPSAQELEARDNKPQNTLQNASDFPSDAVNSSQPDINKVPKSEDKRLSNNN